MTLLDNQNYLNYSWFSVPKSTIDLLHFVLLIAFNYLLLTQLVSRDLIAMNISQLHWLSLTPYMTLRFRRFTWCRAAIIGRRVPQIIIQGGTQKDSLPLQYFFNSINSSSGLTHILRFTQSDCPSDSPGLGPSFRVSVVRSGVVSVGRKPGHYPGPSVGLSEF